MVGAELNLVDIILLHSPVVSIVNIADKHLEKVIGVEPNLPDIISLHLQVVFFFVKLRTNTRKKRLCGTKSTGHSFEGY